MAETAGTSDGAVLTLPLPEFAEDLAGRLEPVKDFSLHAPRLEPDGSFAVTLRGEPGRSYDVETSRDLAAWRARGRVVLANDAAAFRDPAPPPDRRFYRSRLND
jgi:hypothetical protein